MHYRVAIYNYLSHYLSERNINFSVLAECIQNNNPHPVTFDFINKNPGIISITKTLLQSRPDAIILFVNLKHLYLFPVLLIAKALGIKVIYWGHGKDVQDPDGVIKNLLYGLEFYMVDQIILYSDQLIKHVGANQHYKIHIANNTLAITRQYFEDEKIQDLKTKHNVSENIIIVFVGRIQKYKRVNDLLRAFHKIKNNDVGLVIVGSDDENLLGNTDHKRIHYVGALYGDELYMMLSLADIYCMPGAIGLSIVDAFLYGLPIVTEDVQHGPEIMYLRNGVNGFVVPVGDIDALTEKLELLSYDKSLRESMSEQAINEISTNGSIDKMCEGFLSAIESSCST